MKGDVHTRIRANQLRALAAVVLVAAGLLPLTSCVTAGRRHFGGRYPSFNTVTGLTPQASDHSVVWADFNVGG
ncbi:MAG: hypothetical protein ACYS67_03610 [Planctomycetota bacterium]